MYKRLDKILPIFTLCITMLLLVVVVMAWYVENEKVTADGVIGSTQAADVELQVTTYSLSKNGNNYVKGDVIDNMYDYNNMQNNTTAVLIVIEYKFNDVNPADYILSLNTDIPYVISDETYDVVDDLTTSGVDERKLAFQTNYLSNTTAFYQNVSTNDDLNFTIDSGALEYSFVSKNQGNNKYVKDTSNELSIEIVKNTNTMKNYLIFITPLKSVSLKI